MTKKRSVVVVGAGVAGSAIALALIRRGDDVTLLCRATGEGSSFTNQKWNHSGLLYPIEGLAHRACREFLAGSLLDDFVLPAPRDHGRFLALDRKTLDDREAWWNEWGVNSWGLSPRRLDELEYRTIGALGTQAIGGFAVPDRVIDFPLLIKHLP